MAAQSGLSSVDVTLASSSSLATLTWADLCKRQQRVISGTGQLEKRLEVLTRKCESLGWTNPDGNRGPAMSGADWEALAARQQALLQSICAVKDRVKRAAFKVGITNPAYEESIAKPQLMKKMPSHFNNKQLAHFLEAEEERQAGNTAAAATPSYALTKLLVMVLVRDLQRFIAAGAHRPLKSSLTLSAAELAAADAEGRTIRHLIARVVRILCDTHLSEEEVTRMLHEGTKLLCLSLEIDSETRVILQDEPYLVGVDNLQPSAAFTAALAAFHAKQSRSWFTSGVSPFAHFRFTRPPKGLSTATRVPCSNCKKPSSLYCPFCLVPTLAEELQIPPVKLPLHVDIVHHTGENVKKSTSIHACILSPEYCRFLEFPRQLPEYDPRTTILLYPTADAVYLDDPRIDLAPVTRVIVIESTWAKSDVVSMHPSLARLQKVKIRDHESTFWRYQELGRNFLSTLEAIYYTCDEFQQRRDGSRTKTTKEKGASDDAAAATTSASVAPLSPASFSSPPAAAAAGDRSIDDLLYFYAFQHDLITSRYRGGTESAPRSWSGGAHEKVKKNGI